MCQRGTEQAKPDRLPATLHEAQGSGAFRRAAGKWFHKLVRVTALEDWDSVAWRSERKWFIPGRRARV